MSNGSGWAGWKARRLLVAFSVAIYTGLRMRELFTLQISDIDLDAYIIRLTPRGAHGKGLKSDGSAKPVGMPTALVPILESWLSHRLDHPAGMTIDLKCPWLIPTCSRKGPWTTGRSKARPLGRLKAIARRAGIPDSVNWQMCRRSLATAMEGSGAGTRPDSAATQALEPGSHGEALPPGR